MKINISLPFDHIDPPQEFLTPEAVVEISQLIERAGYHGANVTDHPCPSGRWLDHGGHHAQDPFVMLSLVAAATKTLRLQTGILVLPYRNPFITARAVATLDVFSGGRVDLGMGAGYMKSEYSALGVEFERRNELFDEYLLAMKAAWSGADFAFRGSGYEARGNRMCPAPLQKPHPPLYVGGNSRRAIRRAAEHGDAWYPFFTPPQLSNTARTAEITDENDLPPAIAYLHEHCAKIGRTRPPEVVAGALASVKHGMDVEALLERVRKMRAMGVTGTAVHVDARTRRQWCEEAEWFGTEVLPQIARI